jgi:hypothetical protein
MKVVSLPPLRTGRLYPSFTNFCYRLSQPQGHSAAGKIMSMKNCSETIGNRTCDLPTCSAVSQPTALPRAPELQFNKHHKVYRTQYGNFISRGNVEEVQGEHKVFPLLQTFITRKLRGIQTYFCHYLNYFLKFFVVCLLLCHSCITCIVMLQLHNMHCYVTVA